MILSIKSIELSFAFFLCASFSLQYNTLSSALLVRREREREEERDMKNCHPYWRMTVPLCRTLALHLDFMWSALFLEIHCNSEEKTTLMCKINVFIYLRWFYLVKSQWIMIGSSLAEGAWASSGPRHGQRSPDRRCPCRRSCVHARLLRPRRGRKLWHPSVT
jgi:hypothetical protein